MYSHMRGNFFLLYLACDLHLKAQFIGATEITVHVNTSWNIIHTHNLVIFHLFLIVAEMYLAFEFVTLLIEVLFFAMISAWLVQNLRRCDKLISSLNKMNICVSRWS